MSNNTKVTQGGYFRPKKVYFTQVSNEALRSTTLSLKAKGLYALIQSYITIEGFILYKNTLKSDCFEGETAFESAWKELKNKGYLIQYKMKNKETGAFYYEYDLLDIPQEVSNTNNLKDKKTQQDKSRMTEKAHTENLGCGTSSTGKPGVYNNTDLNNTYSMYVSMYEQHLTATKYFKDFIAKNEIHIRMNIELFEYILIEVMNNNRVKKKDKYFLKALKEVANKGLRTVEDYEKDLENYKAKNKTTATSNKGKEYSKPVKTRFHNINESFRQYSQVELEEILAVNQYTKFGESHIRKYYYKALQEGLNSLATEECRHTVVQYAKETGIEIPK